MSACPSLEIDPVENPDWDHARAMRVLIRSPTMEWSSSVRSVEVEAPGQGRFLVPNRNMPVEGLTVLMRGEPWKAIDGVGISVSGAKLTPSRVRYSICAARYSYAFEDGGSVSVEYAPADSGVAQVGGSSSP